ncbi:MAG: hypothetical protein AAF485_11505, partial [Chloroflexota bacterium]
FWGVPILEQDPFFPIAYLIMLIFCGVALFGLWRIWQAADQTLRFTLGLLISIFVLLLPFPVLRFFLTYNVLETGQGRHILYPAAQVIPILLTLGWLQVAQLYWYQQEKPAHKQRAYPTSGRLYTFAPLLILLLWASFQLSMMVRTYPDPLPVQTTTFKPETIPQPLKHQFGPDIQYLGYDFVPDEKLAVINLTLFWQSLAPVQENYRTRVQLVDNDGLARFVWISHPLNGLYPTRAWDKGDVIRDTLPLPLAAVPANIYSLQIDLLHEAEDTPLTETPFEIIQIPLNQHQPIADASTLGDFSYRLWLDITDTSVRHRQTIPLSWQRVGADNDLQTTWALIGPDDVPRFPVALGDATDIFVVGPHWPSGDYRLQVSTPDSEPQQTHPLLTVANEARTFVMPTAETIAGFTSVNATFASEQGDPHVALLGYTLPTRRAEPGGGLPITLYWQSLAPVLDNYVIFDVLLNEDQARYGGYDRLPREFYSTILWADKEVVEDGFVIPVDGDAPPGVYEVRLGLYPKIRGSSASLALMANNQPTDQTSVVIGPIKVGGPPADVVTDNPMPQYSLNQPFNGQLTLLGYDVTADGTQPLSSSPDTPISNLHLTLYWQVDSPLDINYTTFFHLRDATNTPVAQKDSPPAQGRYPTSLWDSGEIIVDQLILPIEQVSAGEYTPVIGLYDFQTGIRLATDGIPENEVRLESIRLP